MLTIQKRLFFPKIQFVESIDFQGKPAQLYRLDWTKQEEDVKNKFSTDNGQLLGALEGQAIRYALSNPLLPKSYEDWLKARYFVLSRETLAEIRKYAQFALHDVYDFFVRESWTRTFGKRRIVSSYISYIFDVLEDHLVSSTDGVWAWARHRRSEIFSYIAATKFWDLQEWDTGRQIRLTDLKHEADNNLTSDRVEYQKLGKVQLDFYEEIISRLNARYSLQIHKIKEEAVHYPPTRHCLDLVD